MSGHTFGAREWLLTFREMMENSDHLKIAKYEPLIFECATCGQRFDASAKSLQQIEDEVSAHVAENHPELLRSAPQQRAA